MLAFQLDRTSDFSLTIPLAIAVKHQGKVSLDRLDPLFIIEQYFLWARLDLWFDDALLEGADFISTFVEPIHNFIDFSIL